MKDMRNKEVKIGDLVVFNHPVYRILDMASVIDITAHGVRVNYYTLDNTNLATIIPERQFVIIGADKELTYGD